MSSQNNNRFVTFIKTPFGAMIVIGVFVVLVALIIASIIRLNENNEEGLYYSEEDPASGTTIYYGPPTGGEQNPYRTVGFEDALLANGMTSNQYYVFLSAVEKYAKENEITLTRVSYLKDSYSLADSYVFDFKIVLNIDRMTLKVRVDSSKGYKNIMGMVVTLWNEDGEEVYKLKVTNENICDYSGYCNDYDGDA